MSLTQEEIIKMMFEYDINEPWAKKSKFYKKIMDDGNVFNPYLHRRFLPAHFHKLIKQVGSHNVQDENYFIEKVQVYYGAFYFWKFLFKEIGTISFLQKRDRLAYQERSAVMPLERLKQIYLNAINIFIIEAEEVARTCGSDCKLVYLPHTKISKYLEQLKSIGEQITSSNDFESLGKVDSSFIEKTFFYRDIKLKCQKEESLSKDLTREIIKLFLLSGSYYTLKSYYMFDSNTEYGVSSCGLLFKELESGKRNWQYFTLEWLGKPRHRPEAWDPFLD